MTIRLLCAWGAYPANAVVTLDAGTEAGLIAQKIASTSLTGGVPVTSDVTLPRRFAAVVETTAAGNVRGVGDEFGGTVIERRPAYRKRNYFVKRPNVIDNMDACERTWSKGGSHSSFFADYDNPRPNSPAQCALSMTVTTSFVPTVRDFGAGNGIKPSDGVILVPVYLSDMPMSNAGDPESGVGPTYVNCNVTIMFSTTNDFSAAAVTATSLVFSQTLHLRPGWNDLLMSHLDVPDVNGTPMHLNNNGPALTYANGATADTTFRYMRIVLGGMQPTAYSPAPVVRIGGIYQGGMSQPNVLLNCDDGQYDTEDLIRIYNARRHMVSIGVIVDNVGKAQFMGWDRLVAINEAGNDIIGHTMTHPVVPSVGEARMRFELSESMKALRQNRLPRTADVMCFPTNQFGSRELKAMREMGYSAARGAKPCWTATVFGIDNPLALGSRDLGGKTLAQAIRALDAAEAYGVTVILYMHQIMFTRIASLTISGNVATATYAAAAQQPIPATPNPVYPAGTILYLRGAADPAHRVAATVLTSDTSGFTASVTNVPNGTAVAGYGTILRCFSPTYPAADAAPPSDSLFWYFSQHIAFANEIAKRESTGRLTAITYADLLDECSY